MSEHQALIWKKLDHLARMREYLAYSLGQIQQLLSVKDWSALQPDQHESLAYEDNPQKLHEFFGAMLASAPELLRWHDQLLDFCRKIYPR